MLRLHFQLCVMTINFLIFLLGRLKKKRIFEIFKNFRFLICVAISSSAPVNYLKVNHQARDVIDVSSTKLSVDISRPSRRIPLSLSF